MSHLKTAMVLGGGGARGAYEAGVISYLREELEPEMGRELKLDILCGTSVGAIHACYLAATAGLGPVQARNLVDHWMKMRVNEVLTFGLGDLLRFLRETFGTPGRPEARQGGLVDPQGLRNVVGRSIPWLSIGRNLRKGNLEALSVSATHVASGRTLIFIQKADPALPMWGRDPHLRAISTSIGPKHALASAAIPVIFPAVRLRGHLFVDGGLRLNVPLSPALRLGASRVIVVTLKPQEKPIQEFVELEREVNMTYATAPFLFGKTLNALLLDRTDQDLDRLSRINSILEAGTQTYGPGFARTLGDAVMPHRNQPVRYVRTLLVRPSKDLGTLAGEYARSAKFRKSGKSLTHRAIFNLVDREGSHSADLASYLLFDKGFADILIELGRNDARAQRDAWLKFWSDAPQSAAEAAQRVGEVSAA